MLTLSSGIRAAAAAAILFAGGTIAQAAGAECAEEHGLRSKRGDQPTELVFVNKKSHPVRIYWINYDGGRKFYAEVRPHQEHVQQTYRTHPWVVTDRQENCLGVYFPHRHGKRVVIH